VVGNVKNDAENHRLRIGVRTGKTNSVSHAGTQYGVIQRPVVRPEMAYWRERGYFEEPSSTNCLLNHVSAVDEKGALTIYTRSLKEYELVGEGYGDMMLTVLRAMGFVGRPDLHRRPGRPSGMPERYLPAPTHQMKLTVEFDFGIGFSKQLDANKLFREYALFAIDETYVQNQKMDPTFFLISYFPINEWETTLPAKFNLATLENSNASFGTLIKSDGSEEYILRLFNAESEPKDAGSLALGDGFEVVAKTDLVEEAREKRDGLGEQFGSGELLNLVIKQNGKG
jgi:mannosylglycerate hydrolase